MLFNDRVSYLAALLAVICHGVTAVVSLKPRANPPCLTQSEVSQSPVVTRGGGIQPCPCLSEALRKDEVKAVISNAELVGVGQVARTASSTAQLWVARIHTAAQRARAGLDSLRWGQVESTRDAIEAERQKEASVAWRMKEAVLTANTGLDATAMTKAAEDWARTEAMQEIVNLTNATMMELSAEEAESEELRVNSTSDTQSMLEAAREMASTANAAETLAFEMQKDDPENFVTAIEAEDQKVLAEVELSRSLSANAKKAGEEAGVLANSALLRAKAAEVGAVKALATAKRNTDRIAKLKARVQKAQQRAVAAASGAGAGDLR